MSIPAFAWAMEQGVSLSLKPAERLVLLYLSDKANGARVCWPGQETIARCTGLALRTVRSVLRQLTTLGLIRTEAAPGIVTRYHIQREDTPANHTGASNDTPGNPSRGNPGKTSLPTPANSAPPPRQNLHGTPANGAPNPGKPSPRTLSEPSIEPKTRAGAREAEDSKTGNLKATALLPAASYESPDVARARFRAYLEAKRGVIPEAPDDPVGQDAAGRVTGAVKYALVRRWGPEEKNPTEAQSRDQQIAQLLGIQPRSSVRPTPVEPVRTVQEQLAALGVA